MPSLSGPRQLTFNDIGAAMALSTEAGWNQTSDDWRMLMKRDPETCFALDVDGELAATTTVVSYGSRLGWIGMVLTRERFRRLGCARLLVTRAIETAQAKGLKTLKLDATEMGTPLYSSLGFQEEQAVERWRAEFLPRFQSPPNFDNGDIPEQLDRKAFGADRIDLITLLLSRFGARTISAGSYALARPGRVARYIGPCVATDRAAAEEAIRNVISPPMAIDQESAWYWDLLPGNPEAVALARRLGFAPVRKLRRMWHGDALRACDEHIYAIAGFELG